MNELEQYYFSKRNSLKNVCGAFNKSSYGTKNKVEIPLSYEGFTNLVPFSDTLLQINPRELVMGNFDALLKFTTSGTTGGTKEVYVSEHENLDVIPQFIKEELLKNKNAVISGVHSKRYELEFMYWKYTSIYRSYCSKFQVFEFFDQKSAVEGALSGDIVVLYDYPSSIVHFLYYLEDFLLRHPDYKKRFLKKTIIEITGEPISLEELNQISKRVKNIFGSDPLIWVSYGLTEIGGVGLYEYSFRDKEIVYQVSNEVFVEILDAQNKSVVPGEEGQITVTPLRTKGTILLRYRTQDSGKLIFRGTNPYLKLFGRNISSSTIFIAGSQFLVASLIKVLNQNFQVIPKLTILRIKNQEQGTEKLIINLYFPEKILMKTQKHVENFIFEWILTEAKIQEEVKEGRVEIVIKSYESEVGPLKQFSLSTHIE